MICGINNEDIFKNLFKDFGCLSYFYDHANMLYNCDNIRIHYRNFEKIVKDNTISVDFGDVNAFSINDIPLIIDTTRFPLNVHNMYLNELDDFKIYDGKNIKMCKTHKMIEFQTDLLSTKHSRLIIKNCPSLTHIINVNGYDCSVFITNCENVVQISLNSFLETLDISNCKKLKSFKNIKIDNVNKCYIISTDIDNFDFCEDTSFCQLFFDCYAIKDFTQIEKLRVSKSLMLSNFCFCNEFTCLLRILNVKTQDITFDSPVFTKIFSKYFTNIKIDDRIEHIMDVLLDCHENGIENICY